MLEHNLSKTKFRWWKERRADELNMSVAMSSIMTKAPKPSILKIPGFSLQDPGRCVSYYDREIKGGEYYYLNRGHNKGKGTPRRLSR